MSTNALGIDSDERGYPKEGRHVYIVAAARHDRMTAIGLRRHGPPEGAMNFNIETERETDGRWIAEIPGLPGGMKYGRTREDAIAQVEALTLRVLADRIEHDETPLASIQITFAEV
jgi:predicted RNase H-like HicB family nuclease